MQLELHPFTFGNVRSRESYEGVRIFLHVDAIAIRCSFGTKYTRASYVLAFEKRWWTKLHAIQVKYIVVVNDKIEGGRAPRGLLFNFKMHT